MGRLRKGDIMKSGGAVQGQWKWRSWEGGAQPQKNRGEAKREKERG